MPPGLHAVLGASSAHRWLACPPSARLCERLDAVYGKADSPWAVEGTRAHGLAEIKVKRALYKVDGMTMSKLSRLPKTARAAYVGINDNLYKALRSEIGDIPEDMDRATDTYADVVIDRYLRAREEDPAARLLLEQRLDYSRWVPAGFGTGDALILSTSIIEVLDYKHGVGIPVNAVGNPQTRLYGLGAYDAYCSLYDPAAVRMTIVQPRLDSLTEETMVVPDLLEWADTVVVPAAKLAWAGKGEFSPGEHCRFCAAKAICSAREAEALKLFRYGLETPGTIPDEQIPDILATLDLAEDWIADIRAYAESAALRGQRWPGFKLVRGKRPNRKWTDPDEVKAALLRAGYGPDTFEETKLKGPGDVEKSIGKTAFSALLSECVAQGEGKLTLVPESDHRAEYQPADAAFADLTNKQTDETGGNENGELQQSDQ